jgi:hypothetical protein
MAVPTLTLSQRLHDVFIAATRHVRTRFGNADVGGFYLSIEAQGRTLTDEAEIKIEYRLGTGRYDDKVTGNDLERCIVEMLRRHGWDETNAPKALPAPPVKKTVTV